MTAKRLSDLIIEHGPYVAGGAMPFPTGATGHPLITADQVNALRDELIELRAIKARRDREATCRWDGDCEGTDECPGCRHRRALACSVCGSLRHGRDDCPRRGRNGSDRAHLSVPCGLRPSCTITEHHEGGYL